MQKLDVRYPHSFALSSMPDAAGDQEAQGLSMLALAEGVGREGLSRVSARTVEMSDAFFQ